MLNTAPLGVSAQPGTQGSGIGNFNALLTANSWELVGFREYAGSDSNNAVRDSGCGLRFGFDLNGSIFIKSRGNCLLNDLDQYCWRTTLNNGRQFLVLRSLPSGKIILRVEHFDGRLLTLTEQTTVFYSGKSVVRVYELLRL